MAHDLQRRRHGGLHRWEEEHFRCAHLPRLGPNFVVVVEVEGGGVVYVRGEVRGGSYSGMPSCVAAG